MKPENDKKQDKPDQDSELIGPASAEMSEAYARIMGKLADDNPETRKMMSDLSPEQIRLLSICYTRARKFNCDMERDICDQFIQLRHSKNRLSRREVVDLSGAIRDQHRSGHWWQRLFNRGQ